MYKHVQPVEGIVKTICQSNILYMNVSAGDLIYNNIFNTSTNDSGVFINNSEQSDFNITKTSGTNIVGKSYLGGNFWTNSTGNGYSDTCTESDGDYICDSSYRIMENNDFFDYFPLTLTTSYTPPSNPNSPGGSSSSYWRATYIINNTQFRQGYTKELIERSRIQITIDNINHYVALLDLTASTAEISVSSTPQQETFSEGDIKGFDVTGDGSYDMLVILNGIIGNKANVTVSSMPEETTNAPPETEEKEEEKNATGEEENIEKIGFWKTLIIISSIIVLILIIYSVFKKRKARKIKRRHELFYSL